MVVGLCWQSGYGQAVASIAAGAWNVGANWDSGTPPTAANSTSITLNHNINIPSGFTATVDQVAVTPGNTLTVDAGGTLSLQNSGGTDLDLQEDFVLLFIGSNLVVNGTYINNSTTPVNYGTGLSSTTFNSGGKYTHAVNGLALPFNGASWDANATAEITGVTTTAPGNTNQSFGHFTWNCAGQGAVNPSLGLHQATINGNLTISNTGTGLVTLSNTTGTIPILGNFVVSGTGRFLGVTNVNATINVGGDFTLTSTNTNPSLLISTGLGVTLNFNVSKNFTVSGKLQSRATSNPTVNVNFNGSTVQTFNTAGGTLTQDTNWTIKTGATVDMGTSPFIQGGIFTLEAGGAMKVGSADGLNTGTSIGNVRVTGTRTYTANSNVIYNGSVAQNLGTEWGAGGGLNGVQVNLEINNSSGGGVTNNIIGTSSVVGILTLTQGSLNIGNSNTLDIKSNFVATAGTIGGDATSNLTFSGSGTITGNLTFKTGTENLNNFTISRSATITLGSNLTIATGGTLAFTSADLRLNGNSLTVGGNITNSGSGGISSLSTTSNLTILGSGALTAFPFCTSCGTMEFNNITLNRGSGTYTWGSAARVNGTLDLLQGTLTHTSGITMVNGSTFALASTGSITTAAPNTTGSYNVTYTGDQTTGLELPSSGTALNNLTSAGNVTLDKTITINGDLVINSGTLSASTFNVTAKGANFTVNSGLFTIAASGVVTFARSGTTAMGGAAINNTQFGNLTVNSGATLSAPNANINVSGTWNNLGTFTANSSTVTFNGASQNLNPNGQAFNNVVFGGSGTKTLLGTLTANGTLSITSTLDVGANLPINVAGSWSNTGTFTANGGLVTFTGAAQSINSAGQPFFNLTMAGSGTKTLTAAIDINGALTINSGVTFDVGVSSFTINLAGNLANNGTFTQGNGTVIFDGTSAISGSSSTNFNNVTIAGALTATSGTSLVGGDWLQSSGTFAHNGGTLDFNGSTQSITPGAQTFNNVTISGSNTKTLVGAGVINGALTFSAGTFNSNGQTLDLKGNLVSNAASVLTASALTFSGTTTISGGTTPTFGGITITGSLTPTSSFNINGNLVNNGTLNAGSGTVTFGGTTAISGSSTSSFNNVVIGSTLTAPSGTMNVAGSWTNNGTYNANNGTTVFNGTTTVGGSVSSTFANLTISSILTAPASVLGVSGNFTNNGTFNNGGGTVTFTGSGSQSISGSSSTTFNNINAQNNSGTNINGTARLDGVLTLNASGVFDADGSGSGIFIVSSSSVSAGGRIAALPTPGNFSGQVTVERFIHGQSGGDYRFLSMPITTGNLSLWRNSISVTGDFSDASTGTNIVDNTRPSVFTYDAATQAYVAVTGGGAATSTIGLNSRIGYAAYDFNDGAVTASYRGPIETGTIPITISNTNNNFNLVPNPYPSPIDWDLVTKTNVNNAMWIRTGNNVFSSYVSGVPTNAPFGGWTGEVGIGQSFWTQSNGGGTTHNFNEADKTGNSFQFLRTAAVDNIIRIQLTSGSQQDETVIRFVNTATDAIDAPFDAVKRRNGNYVSALGQNNYMNLSSYLTTPSSDFAINSIAELGKAPQSKVIKLKVIDVVAGNYSLNFSELSSLTLGYKVYLEDKFLNQERVVTDGFVYDFSVTANALSYGDSRFSLRFVSEQLVTAVGDEMDQDVVAYPNPVADKLYFKLSDKVQDNLKSIVLVDVRGNVVVSSEKDQSLMNPGTRTIDMTNYSSGFYILNVLSGDIIKPVKIIKK